MQWEFAVAIAIAVPVILVPVAFVWYLSIGGTHRIIREARQRQQRRAEVMREAMSMAAAGEGVGGIETGSFWESETPCWKICACASQIREECPAYTAKSALPCWEIEGTFCKLRTEGGASGRDTTICQICPVYKKYGEGRPIQLKPVAAGVG